MKATAFGVLLAVAQCKENPPVNKCDFNYEVHIQDHRYNYYCKNIYPNGMGYCAREDGELFGVLYYGAHLATIKTIKCEAKS